MEIVIIDSAYRHGVSKESILNCLLNFHNDIIVADPPLKRLFVGFDHVGNPLEVVGIEDNKEDCLVVIHAMKLRKKYFYLLAGGR